MKSFITIPLQLIYIMFSLFVVISSTVSAEEIKNNTIDSYSFDVKVGNIDVHDIISVTGLGIGVLFSESPKDSSFLMELHPDRIKFNPITLKKRFSVNSMFNNWIEKMVKGNIEYNRKNIIITLWGYSKKEGDSYIIQRWKLYLCFPISWNLSPLIMNSNDELTEQLVVVCERLEEESNL